MNQLSLLNRDTKLTDDSQSANQPIKLDMPDADVRLYPGLFSSALADDWFRTLRRESAWVQEQITICGKTMDIPRLTAWCGEANKTYTYSGIRVRSSPWTPTLIEIKRNVELVSATTFNSVLLNLYRDGSDSVAWHADDEKELGENPVIGSVSLGATRNFQMKHNKGEVPTRNFALQHGDYLLMQGAAQHAWRHQIPKTKEVVGERINLTFRTMLH